MTITNTEDRFVQIERTGTRSKAGGIGKKMTLVPGASHLFEESGALEYAARLAGDWFQKHLDAVNVR